MSLKTRTALAALAALVISCTGSAQATTLNFIYDFSMRHACSDGANPSSPIIMDTSGNVYGTTIGNSAGYQVPNGNGFYFGITQIGPNSGTGRVYEVTP